MNLLRACTLSLLGFAACSLDLEPPTVDWDDGVAGSAPQAGTAPNGTGGSSAGAGAGGAVGSGGKNASSGAGGSSAGTAGQGSAGKAGHGNAGEAVGGEATGSAGEAAQGGTSDAGGAGAGGERAGVGVIGPLGGELTSEDGRVRLEVPPCALPSETELRVEVVPNPPAGAVGPVYELSPSGMTFAVPVTLTLPVPSDFQAQDFRGLRVATLVNGEWSLVQQQWLEYETPSVGALLRHFSTYALRPSAPKDACLCDAEVNAQCCQEEGGALGPCSCSITTGFWDYPTCLTSWRKHYEFNWGVWDCYDDRAEPPPPQRYCTPDWEQCCRNAGGIGPIADGTPLHPLSGESSEECVCDLGCGAALPGSIDWGALNFRNCLLVKEKEGKPLVYEDAVCGPPDAQGGGTPGEGDGYCNGAISPALLGGPGGNSWYLYGGPGACADLLSLPTPTLISASLESGANEKALLGTSLAATDLSGSGTVWVTAEVTPVGAQFEASLASGNGVRGMTWEIIAQPGFATYQLPFTNGNWFTNDTASFDFHRVESFDVSTSFITGGSVTAKVRAFGFLPGTAPQAPQSPTPGE